MEVSAPPVVQSIDSDLYQIDWSDPDFTQGQSSIYVRNFEQLKWNSPTGASVYGETIQESILENQSFLVGLGEVFPQIELIQSFNIVIDDDASSQSWVEAFVAQVDNKVTESLVIETSLLSDDQQQLLEAELQDLNSGAEFSGFSKTLPSVDV